MKKYLKLEYFWILVIVGFIIYVCGFVTFWLICPKLGIDCFGNMCFAC